jgi:hypothetical protein
MSEDNQSLTLDSVNWKTLIAAIKCHKYNLYKPEAQMMSLEKDISTFDFTTRYTIESICGLRFCYEFSFAKLIEN